MSSNGAIPDVIDLVDLDAEMRYLGAALMTPGRVKDHDLDPQCFFRDEHKVIYRAIVRVVQFGKYTDGEAYPLIAEVIRQELGAEEAKGILAMATEMLTVAEPIEATEATAALLRGLDFMRRARRLPFQIEQAIAAIPDPARLASRINALTGFVTDREAGPPQPKVAEVPEDELGSVLRLWEMPRPGPRPQLIVGIAPAKWPWMIFGPGGSGKSHLGTYTAVCVATGRDWFGHQSEPGPVLIVDSELDDEEARQRLWPICIGLGLETPPEGIFYYRLPKALSDERVLKKLKSTIDEHGISLVIVDSLTLSTYLSDQSAPNDISRIVFTIAKWGLSFCFIDHEPKHRADNDPGTASAFGTVFKGNLMRAQIYVQPGTGETFTLHCRKTNFTKRWAPIALETVFFGPENYPDMVVYKRLAENDPRNLAMKRQQRRGQDEEALRVLAEQYPEGVTAKLFAEYLAVDGVEVTIDNARMRLGRMERDQPPLAKRVNPEAKGRTEGLWLPTADPTPTPPWSS